MSYFIFKSLSHFEFIFVHDMRVCSSFTDLHAAVQFSQQYLLKRLFPILFLASLSVWVYSWAHYSVPLVCMSVLVPVLHCLDDCGFVILPEVWESYASCLVFIPQNCFGNLWLHVNFWIVCSSSAKNVVDNLIGIALYLKIALGSMAIFTILIFPTQEQ